jgi:hypothetical protein
MEALKLAFETVIVGLFALPWLWVMIDLLNPNVFHFSGIRRMTAYVPAELRTPAIGITLFSLVYLLGSMITPVAHEFFNDPDMLGQFLPTDEKIQAYNFKQVGGTTGSDHPLPAKFELVDSRDANAAAEEAESVTDKFEREQSAVLLHGPDSSERLNRLHEQLIVLRGAAFSAFALMVLCGFAWCGRYNTEGVVAGGKSFLRLQLRCSIALVISSAFILLAGRSLIADLHSLQSGDMPIAEIVLLVLGGFGLYVAIGGTRSRIKFHGVMCVFAFCFALLCYTGYGCTERAYDQEVFYTYQALTPSTGGESVHAVERHAMTASLNE